MQKLLDSENIYFEDLVVLSYCLGTFNVIGIGNCFFTNGLRQDWDTLYHIGLIML